MTTSKLSSWLLLTYFAFCCANLQGRQLDFLRESVNGFESRFNLSPVQVPTRSIGGGGSSSSIRRPSPFEESLTFDRCPGRFNFEFESVLTSGNIPEDRPLPCKPEPDCPRRPSKHYRSDGSCNNLFDVGRGQTGRAHKRLVNPAYADGTVNPRVGENGRPLPSARKISNEMQSVVRRKSSKHTHMVVIFGQYLTHDITSTPTTSRNRAGGGYSGSSTVEINCGCGSRDPACVNIAVPKNDPQWRGGITCLPVIRSQPVANNICQTRIREQQNLITPYLDAGTVYGASSFQMSQLLDPSSRIGELKTGNLSPHGQSPANAPSLPLVGLSSMTFVQMACPVNIHKPSGVPCFAAGDNRANENPALLSLHTMFVRLHNKIVKGLNRINPSWSRTKLIDTARSIVAAITQRITYKEYLPEILGSTYMKRFGLNLKSQGYARSYNQNVDATTSNAFATAALRFGHTLVTTPLTRQNPYWSSSGPSMSLKNHFFNSEPLLNTTHGGANSVLRGLCKDAAEYADPIFIDDLRNHLFARPGEFGFDLLAINIQRGRDHGLPGYNSYRKFCGLRKARTFNDFAEIPANRRRKLKQIYRSKVNDVDLYIAGLAENPVPGGLLGPTFTCILSRQFRDIKNGDRLWHENGGTNQVFTTAQLRAIRNYKLSRLICDTMKDTRTIQPNPFQHPSMAGNRRRSCSSYTGLNLDPWLESTDDVGIYSYLCRALRKSPVGISGGSNSGGSRGGGGGGGTFIRQFPGLESFPHHGIQNHPLFKRSIAARPVENIASLLHLCSNIGISGGSNSGGSRGGGGGGGGSEIITRQFPGRPLTSHHMNHIQNHPLFKRSIAARPVENIASRLQLCSNIPIEESITNFLQISASEQFRPDPIRESFTIFQTSPFDPFPSNIAL